LYLRCTWRYVQLSGGVGSIYPENVPEYLLFIGGILVGSVVWAMVVGTICAMFTMGDPHATEYHQTMDELNDFLEDVHVPAEIGTAARAYLRSTRELQKKLSYDNLMTRLSPGLRGTIMLCLSKATVSKVWYLELCEPECLVQLASKLTRAGFPPRERMTSTTLNIISRGIAARGGDLLYSGSCWGSDIILTAPVLRDTRLITALTYVEVQALTREDLYAVLDAFPESARSVQNAAVRMALKRTVVLLKAYADAQRVGVATDGAVSASGSKAYSMLTAAFTPAGPDEAVADTADLGHIFRIITGSKLRDVDAEGNLIEQVALSPNSKHARYAMTAADESRALRAEVGVLKESVRDVHRKLDGLTSVLQQLVAQSAVGESSGGASAS